MPLERLSRSTIKPAPFSSISPQPLTSPQIPKLGVASSTFGSDRIQRSSARNPVRQTVDAGTADIGAVSKGLDANQTLPRRYHLIPLEVKPNSTGRAAIVDEKNGAFIKNGKFTGPHAVRFDGPHGYQDESKKKIMLGHHLNSMTLPKGVRDPHIPVSRPIVEGARGLVCGLENVEREVRPVAVAADAVRLGSALQQDGGRFGEHAARAGTSIIGGWIGAYVGGSAGAPIGEMVGAGIGLAVGGPPGAIMGGAIGGVLGGLGGSVGGGVTGTRLGETVVDHMRKP